MPCPSCNGCGCDECAAGRIEIKQCPLEVITDDVWETLELAELYEKGLPPVSGGSLEQAAIFVAASRFIWSAERAIKKELGIIG